MAGSKVSDHPSIKGVMTGPGGQTDHRRHAGQPAGTFYDDADAQAAPDDRSTPA